MSRARSAFLVLVLCASTLGSSTVARADLPCAVVPDVNDKCPLWLQTYGFGMPVQTAISPTGNLLFMIGQTGSPWTHTGDMTLLARRTDTGAVAWTATYDGPSGGNDRPSDLAVAPDGSTVYVTGAQDDPYTPDDGVTGGNLVTIAFDTATGERRWVGSGDPGWGSAVTVSSDGRRVVDAGAVVSAAGTTDYVVRSLDAATGAVEWTDTYDGPNHGQDEARAVRLDPNGDHVFVTGYVKGPGSDSDFFDKDRNATTIAYGAEDGRRIWIQDIDSEAPDWGWEEGRSVVVGPEGATVFVSAKQQTSQASLTAYDAATGEQRWQRIVSTAADTDIQMSRDGTRLFMTGLGSTDEQSWDTTVSFDAATGTTLWRSNFDSVLEGHTDHFPVAYDVAASPDGTVVYVSGIEWQVAPLSWDMITTAFDATTGERTWFARYNNNTLRNGQAVGRFLDVSPDGATVYTSGSLGGPPGPSQFSDKHGWVSLAYSTADGSLPDPRSARTEPQTPSSPGVMAPCPGTEGLGPARMVCITPPVRTPRASGSTPAALTAAAPDGPGSCAGVPLVRDRCESWVGVYDTKWNHGYPFYGTDVPTATASSGGRAFVTGWTYDIETHTMAYATAAFDGATGNLLWSDLFPPKWRIFSQPLGMAASPDGSRVYVTGVTNWDGGFPGHSSFVTLAYDAATGKRLWVSTYNGTQDLTNIGFAVTTSSDGRTVYATGISDLSVTSNDVVLGSASGSLTTIAYDADTGNREWVARHGDGPLDQTGPDAGYAIAPDPSGGVVVTGPSRDRDGTARTDLDMLTISYSADGTERWVARHDRCGCRTGNDEVPVGLAVAPDGSGVYVTGWHIDDPSNGAPSFETVAYDTATGAERWHKAYGGTNDNFGYAFGLALSPDGSKLAVAGYVGTGQTFDGLTVSYDTATGAERWATRDLGAAPPDLLYLTPSVVIGPNGSVYVQSQQEIQPLGQGVRSDTIVTAYSLADGSRLWGTRYNTSSTFTDFASGVGLTLSPDALHVFSAAWLSHGQSQDGNNDDYGMIAYQA